MYAISYKYPRLLSPENQAITTDLDVIIHDITGEDAFVVIACNHVVSKPPKAKSSMKLAKICDHCLAPDTEGCNDDDPTTWDEEHATGCANMTVLIVAILNEQSRLAAFKARQKAREE